MLICTQQHVEQNRWEDVDTPDGVDTVKEWAKRLQASGIMGQFRGTEVPDDPSKGPQTYTFAIVQMPEYRIEWRANL
jgi:hypothetical protein